MPTFYAEDIDIDVDEFISSCSSSEIQELIECLVEGGYINRDRIIPERGMSVGETFYVEAIEKLADKYHMLTQEEEELIIKLSKRF